MALSLVSPCSARLLPRRSPPGPRAPSRTTASLLLLLLTRWTSTPDSFPSARRRFLSIRATPDTESSSSSSSSTSLDEELLRRLSRASDADKALELFAEARGAASGFVGASDCRAIVAAALSRGNAELALSIFSAMRSTFGPGTSEEGPSVERWMWARPDVQMYALLVRGLAASLRVSDAIRMLVYVSRMGVSSSGEEVPFGKIVRCPDCQIAIAVVQPQHGVQVASCSKCRYQYELVSGDIVSIDSEEIRVCSCRTQHGFINMGKGSEVPTNNEKEHSRCSPLSCGPYSYRDCSNPQICY